MGILEVSTWREDSLDISIKSVEMAKSILASIDVMIDSAYTHRDFDNLGELVRTYREFEKQMEKVFGKETEENEQP